MAKRPVVIVGAGHAGFQLASSLRQAGYAEPIFLLNDEPHLPYQRPPLSKAYLKGGGAPDSLMFRPDKFYRDQNIELIADRAASIDRPARRLSLASGASLEYEHLVLATGARNRLLDLPNANLEDVLYLRTLDESEVLRQRLASRRHVVVIGAGFIGLEFAATARAKGLEVDVVELGARVMARAVTAEISEFFQRRHAEAGIRIHFGVQVTSIESDGARVAGVSLSDGRHIAADLVVVGVGVLPNVELAGCGRPAGGLGHYRWRTFADVGPAYLGGRRLRALRQRALRRLVAAGVGAERHRSRALCRGAADRRHQGL